MAGIVLNVEKRERLGTGAARATRRTGLVPGVLYGGARGSIPIEINAADVKMAQEQFTFLSDSPAEIQLALGDARLSLETEEPQRFDLLVLDAFSGDAIPTHLLTSEAMAMMLRHMQPDGIIAVHISNLHFDLRPVVASLAEEFHFHSALIDDRGTQRPADFSSRWVLLARDSTVLKHPSLSDAVTKPPEKLVRWTDDFSNLFNVLD